MKEDAYYDRVIHGIDQQKWSAECEINDKYLLAKSQVNVVHFLWGRGTKYKLESEIDGSDFSQIRRAEPYFVG